jgi:hypothetical protein
MKAVRNTVEDAKFIIATMVGSVPVVEWPLECHQLIKGIKNGSGDQY